MILPKHKIKITMLGIHVFTYKNDIDIIFDTAIKHEIASNLSQVWATVKLDIY